MGLIKKDQVEEKGTLLLERKIPFSLLAEEKQKKENPPLFSDQPLKEQVAAAKSEAWKIIDRAKEEAEAIRREAREAGHKEGKEKAASHIEEALETLNQAVQERKKIVRDAENEILRLALKIAEQIIRSEVSLHRDVCLNIVAEAISRISDREQVIIRVNREDSEYLKRYKDRLTGMLDGVKSFSILEDANVEPGGCLIETNLGFVDAKISTKLKSIEEALKKAGAEEQR